MSAQTLPLFQVSSMTIDEMINHMEALADKKFKDFSLSLGYFKTKTFARSHTAWVIVLRKDDSTACQSIAGDSFRDMLFKVITFIEKL